MYWQAADFTIDLSRPVIMGILNITPDSFSDGGKYLDHAKALDRAGEMLKDGALIIDIGGESTRPGADAVDENEELSRVLPVAEKLAAEGVIISIDTRRAAVAAACINAGAAIINDVSGFRDPAMRKLAAASNVGCIVMHMLGEPRNMQVNPTYTDVVAEVKNYLINQASQLESLGVASERICIDPGPGFGKTYDHNLALLQATGELAGCGYALMAAFSRKRFIGILTGASADHPDKRVAGSVAVAVWAASRGAHILRVHDVAPTVQALQVWQSLELRV